MVFLSELGLQIEAEDKTDLEFRRGGLVAQTVQIIAQGSLLG